MFKSLKVENVVAGRRNESNEKIIDEIKALIRNKYDILIENLLKGLKEDRSPVKTAAGEERIGKNLKYRKIQIIEETKEDKGDKYRKQKKRSRKASRDKWKLE